MNSRKRKDHPPRKKKHSRKQDQTPQAPKPVLFYVFFGFLVVLLPLIHNTDTLDQVMMPRLFALSLFLSGFSLLFFFSSRPFAATGTLVRSWFFPLLLLWFAISVVTTLLASNPVEGLFDLIKILHTSAIVYMGTMLLIRTEKWIERLIPLAIAFAVISVLIGLVEYYQKVVTTDALTIAGDPYNRPVIYLVDGLMAHKNLFSIAIFLALPFTVAGVFIQKGVWRWLSVFTVGLQLIFIVILQTRSVWLSILFAGAVAVLILFATSRKFELGRSWRMLLLAGITGGVLLVAGLFYLSARGSQNPYVQQFSSIFDPSAPQNIHRVNIWKSTTEMIREKPVSGFGPGNWKLHAGYYFDGRFFDENQLNWQRPHNDFLWVWAEKGIFGFVIYLSIFGLSLFYLLRVIVLPSDKRQKILALCLVFGFTGYLAASFFDFPYERVFHQSFLGVMFACTLALYHSVRPFKALHVKRMYLLVPMLAVFVFGTVFGHHVIRQEKELKKARAHINVQNWNAVLRHARQAQTPLKNLDPQANPIISYTGLALVNLGDMRNGMDAYREAYQLHPGSINVLNNLGAALFRNEEFEEARLFLEKSVAIFPSHDGVTNLSAVYFKLEEYEKARELLWQIPEQDRTQSMQNNLRAIENMIRRRDAAVQE